MLETRQASSDEDMLTDETDSLIDAGYDGTNEEYAVAFDLPGTCFFPGYFIKPQWYFFFHICLTAVLVLILNLMASFFLLLFGLVVSTGPIFVMKWLIFVESFSCHHAVS
jgi:hypothetical protein